MTDTRRSSDPEAVRRLGEAHLSALRELLYVRGTGYAKFAVGEQIILDYDVDGAYAAARAYGLAERANEVLRYSFCGQPRPAASGLFWPIAARILVDIATQVRLNAGNVRGLDPRLYVEDDGTREGFYMSHLARLLRERVAHYHAMATPDRQALDGLIEQLCSRALSLALDLDVLDVLRAAGCEREFADVQPFREPFSMPGAPQSCRPTDESWARRLADVRLQMLRDLLEVRDGWYDALCIDDQLQLDADIDRAYRRCRRRGLREEALSHLREAYAVQPAPVAPGESWFAAAEAA